MQSKAIAIIKQQQTNTKHSSNNAKSDLITLKFNKKTARDLVDHQQPNETTKITYRVFKRF